MKQNIKYLLIAFFLFNIVLSNVQAQDINPPSGNATATARFESMPVNYYTGLASISVPIFNWSDQNGLSVGVSLDYFSGGIRANESATTAGLGWNLGTGGSVTRVIRGMPDDFPWKGYLYAPSVPLDYRPDGSKYYHDSLDAQQDIFQFNFNGRSGKFFIGKNKQIVTVPLSKLRISYKTSPADSSIVSFCIITEDGIKYEFNELERGILAGGDFLPGYAGHTFNVGWHLSTITPVFGKDTIKFTYVGCARASDLGLGASVNISFGDGDTSGYQAPVTAQSILSLKIRRIYLPDKKVISFVYDPLVKYDQVDMGLNSIQISDSIFRYGYQLVWTNSDTTERSFLEGLRYYTSKYIMKGYKFYYNSPHFHEFGSPGDSLWNKRDHWGFYNGANNGTFQTPAIAGISPGANRNPDSLAIASSLSYIEDPSGGKTYYEFENNDVYRLYNEVPSGANLNVKTNNSVSIHVNHITNNTDSFTLFPQTMYIYGDDSPITSESAFTWRITNADSSITYATDTINLADLFFNHTAYSFNVSNLSNGDYLFKTKLVTGSTVNVRSLLVSLKWLNQEPFDGLREIVGGLRIKQISHYDPVTGKTDTISTYRYALPNGRSSGFLGIPPVYDHLYGETISSGGLVTESNYDQISISPVNNQDYTQGSPVGYSRIEVIKGSPTRNLGKEVYIFSSLDDSDLAAHPQIFPYAPHMQEDWLLGLNKKILVYDKNGRFIQQTENTYHTVTQKFEDSNFRSVKLGLTSAIIYDDINVRQDTYAGEYYYPKTGRADLVSSTQSFYYADASEQIKTQQVQYDSNYNAIKTISTYDQSQGLLLERRMYYPYNYTTGGTIGKLKDSAIYTVVSSEDWITGDSNPRMLAASVTDFQQLSDGTIKPLATYALQSKKPLLLASIDSFDASQLIRNSTWIKKQQEFTGFDSAGNCLEIRNAQSGQSNAVIMDYDNRLPVAKISNAKISDIAYSSFESNGNGNWKISSAARTDTASITGKKSYNLSSGVITKGGLNPSLTYIISYWKLNDASVTISGASNVLMVDEQRGWKLYTQDITAVDTVTVSGSGIIDELRLYPKDANMATSTYEPLIGVTSTCDANSTISYFEYDSTNKLVLVRDKDLHILKKYEYSDSLTIRNLSEYGTIYANHIYFDTATQRYTHGCFTYRRYADLVMSDEEKDENMDDCPRRGIEGDGLLPVE